MPELFEELGLEASPPKDQLLNTQMLVLGIWFNTDDMTISVPKFRLLELRTELSHWLKKSALSEETMRTRRTQLRAYFLLIFLTLMTYQPFQ